jgi:hypothetical protein
MSREQPVTTLLRDYPTEWVLYPDDEPSARLREEPDVERREPRPQPATKPAAASESGRAA